MPTKPQPACRMQGCPKIAVIGGWCGIHYKATPRNLDLRQPANLRGYDWKWSKIRNAYIKKHPVCEACWDRTADMVDHRKPKSLGGGDEEENLQSMCNLCHAAKTARMDRKFARR